MTADSRCSRHRAGPGVLGHGVSMAGRQRHGHEEVAVEEETSRMGLGRGWDWKRVVEQNGKWRAPERVCGAGLGHTAVREGWADPW